MRRTSVPVAGKLDLDTLAHGSGGVLPRGRYSAHPQTPVALTCGSMRAMRSLVDRWERELAAAATARPRDAEQPR